MPMIVSRRITLELGLLIGFLALNTILLATFLQPLNGLWSGDQGIKLIQIQNLLLNKFQTTALPYPGSVFDPQGNASPLRGQYYTHNGQTFAMFSDAFAVVSSIPFFFLGFPGLYLVPLLSTGTTLCLVYSLAKRLLPRDWALGIAVLCAVTTPIGFYGVVFWEHAPATMLIVIALWQAIVSVERGSVRRFAIAGAALGIGPWFRNEAILAIIALGVAVIALRPQQLWRCWLWLALGTALAFLPLLLYYQLVFGTLLGPHVMNHVVAFEGAAVPQTLTPDYYAATRAAWGTMLVAPFERLLIAVGILVLVGTSILSLFSKRQASKNLDIWLFGAALGAILVIAIDIQTVRQIPTSLVFSCPLILFSLLPLQAEKPITGSEEQALSTTQSRFGAFLFAFAALYIYLCWLTPLPDGGAQWGPRLLLPAIPPLAIVALWRGRRWFHYLSGTPHQFALIMTLGLLINIGFLAYMGGLSQSRESNRNSQRVLSAVAQSGERVVITDIDYAPALLAQLYFDGYLIYRVDSGADFDALITRLSEGGHQQFYYLGARMEEIQQTSRIWINVSLVALEERLPYRLVGGVYKVVIHDTKSSP